MKKTKQIAMALLILVIATIAMVGLFGLPHEDTTFGVYVALLFASKAVGVLALLAMILVVRWNDKHRWLDIYSRFQSCISKDDGNKKNTPRVS